jgi:NAD dependent epimerase/dehydratase family enzyme
VLGGQRAVPAVLTRAGFAFRDTDLETTLRSVLT